MITFIPDQSSQHIVKLIKGQKNSKKTKPKRFKPAKPVNKVNFECNNISQNKPVYARRLIGQTVVRKPMSNRSNHLLFSDMQSANGHQISLNKNICYNKDKISSSEKLNNEKNISKNKTSDTSSNSKRELNYKQQLLDFATENNMEAPIFSSIIEVGTSKKKTAYIAKVILNGKGFNSLPGIFSSPDDAENEAARYLLNYLKQTKNDQNGIQDNNLCQSNEKIQLISRIKQILEGCQTKIMLSTSIPQCYKEIYKCVIPKNWLEIIDDAKEFFEIEKFQFSNTSKTTIGLRTEPYKNLKSQVSTIDSVKEKIDNIHITKELTNQQILPENLILPSSAVWDVILVKVNSLNNLIMRLVDTCDQYADYISDLHEHYSKQTVGVKNVCIGKIYVAVFEEVSLRVQALRLEGNNVYCFYVDEGGHDILPKSILNEIDNKRNRLPFQAFEVQLAGLNNYANNPNGIKFVEDLLNKDPNRQLALIAEPISREDPIQINLYDTSGDTDLNINSEILKIIQSSDSSLAGIFIPRCELPDVVRNPKCKEDFFHAIVSLPANPQNFIVKSKHHFEQGSDFQKFDSHLQSFYNQEEIIELHPSLIFNGCYICCKQSDNRWYRGRVENVLDSNSTNVLCSLVDVGELIYTSLKNVQPLYSQFAHFPAIAIKASLYDALPKRGDWDAYATLKFKELVNGLEFKSIVQDILYVDCEPVLQLSLFDIKTNSNIRNILIEKGFAIKS